MNTNIQNKIILENVTDFNLAHIFYSGQCFRWEETQKGSFIGVAHNKVIELFLTQNTLTIHNSTEEDFQKIWKHYFDLQCNYSKIKENLSKDAILKEAISFGGGIRILNQDLWECIISFIISANNNIPRIKNIIQTFCTEFGKKISYDGKIFYSFPSLNDLKGIKLSDLGVLKAGFRDKYILDAITKLSDGEVSLDIIKNSCLMDAKNELLKIKGIGEKVSDCILLFGAGKKDVFPVDVWIKRVITNLYADEIGEKKIVEFANDKFGKFAGVAQQYLFYYMRENFKNGG